MALAVVALAPPRSAFATEKARGVAGLSVETPVARTDEAAWRKTAPAVTPPVLVAAIGAEMEALADTDPVGVGRPVALAPGLSAAIP